MEKQTNSLFWFLLAKESITATRVGAEQQKSHAA
jgi:hypothetical protein